MNNEWINDSIKGRMNEMTKGWIKGGMKGWMFKMMNEWMNEWMNIQELGRMIVVRDSSKLECVQFNFLGQVGCFNIINCNNNNNN